MKSWQLQGIELNNSALPQSYDHQITTSLHIPLEDETIPEDLVFQFHQFLLALCNVDHEAVFLLLEFRPLLPHDNAQQLSLQSLLLHSKVNNGCLGRDLRGVMRVAQLGCNIELEVWVKFHLLIPQFDDQAVTCMQQERESVPRLHKLVILRVIHIAICSCGTRTGDKANRALRLLTLFDEGLVEDGGKGGIQLFLYILKQHWTTELHRILKCAQEVRLL